MVMDAGGAGGGATSGSKLGATINKMFGAPVTAKPGAAAGTKVGTIVGSMFGAPLPKPTTPTSGTVNGVNGFDLFNTALKSMPAAPSYTPPTYTTPSAQWGGMDVGMIDANQYGSANQPAFQGAQPTVDYAWKAFNIPAIQQNALTIGDINTNGDFGLPAQVAAIRGRIAADTEARIMAAREQEAARGMYRSGVGVAAETKEQREGDILSAQVAGDAAAKAGELRAQAALQQSQNRVAIATANQNASIAAASQARQAEAVYNELEQRAAVSRGELKMQFLEAANKYRAVADELKLKAQMANQSAQIQIGEAQRAYAQFREGLDLTRQTAQGQTGLGYAELNGGLWNSQQNRVVDLAQNAGNYDYNMRMANAQAEGSGAGLTFDQKMQLEAFKAQASYDRARLGMAGSLFGGSALPPYMASDLTMGGIANERSGLANQFLGAAPNYMANYQSALGGGAGASNAAAAGAMAGSSFASLFGGAPVAMPNLASIMQGSGTQVLPDGTIVTP